MEYNKCNTCGASDGRCGNTVTKTGSDRAECMNCYETRRYGEVRVHVDLPRTEEELQRTMAILDKLRYG